MDANRLGELTSRFDSCRIAVVGDYFLDKYLDFDPALEEISIETGRPAHQVVRIRHSPGAAGNIVGNLVSLGAGEVLPIGFTGDDGEGYDLRGDIGSLGCSDSMILKVPKLHTPTYLKPCDSVIGGIEGERDRYDTKNRERFPGRYEQEIVEMLKRIVPGVDAVIVADQADEEDCGVITCTVRDVISELAEQYPETIFWVDSRTRIGLFRNAILKPNASEAIAAVLPGYDGPIDDEMVFEAGEKLRVSSGKPVFLTCSERGMMIFDETGGISVRGVRIEGPTDPTGAGDSATSAAVLALASGASNAEAALVANLVGSITVQQLGATGRATVAELTDRLALWSRQHKSPS